MRSFGILLVCVVLQTKKNGLPPTEVLVEQGYGLCQLLLTIAVLPVTVWVIGMEDPAVMGDARAMVDGKLVPARVLATTVLNLRAGRSMSGKMLRHSNK